MQMNRTPIDWARMNGHEAVVSAINAETDRLVSVLCLAVI